jgi:hypothetical protein
MKRALFRLAAQLLAIAGPMLTLNWSLLDLLGARPNAQGFVLAGVPFLAGTKAQAELRIRLIVSGLAVLLILVNELVEYYLPARNLGEYRRWYLEDKETEWHEKLGPEVRINIMFARRRWYVLWLFRVFEWTWNDFQPPHHEDANLWLAEWQGVCGRALRTQRPQSVYFREQRQPLTVWQKWFFQNEFRLWGKQFDRTAHLRAIISIPIIVASSDLSPSHRAVGVVNLDSWTKSGAELLENNEDELAVYFTRLGKTLATLRP